MTINLFLLFLNEIEVTLTQSFYFDEIEVEKVYFKVQLCAKLEAPSPASSI